VERKPCTVKGILGEPAGMSMDVAIFIVGVLAYSFLFSFVYVVAGPPPCLRIAPVFSNDASALSTVIWLMPGIP